jgi:hypothetical protein
MRSMFIHRTVSIDHPPDAIPTGNDRQSVAEILDISHDACPDVLLSPK